MKITTFFLALLFATGLTAALLVPAVAVDIFCYPATYLEEVLKKKYKERRVAAGVTNSGWLAERWESANDTWTLVLRAPDGRLCLLSGGEGWRELILTPLQKESIL